MEFVGATLAAIELIRSSMGALSMICSYPRITEQVQSDEVVAGSQRQRIQKIRSLGIAIAGVCPGGQKFRCPVDLKRHARDVEHATQHQKESAAFEFCGYQEKQRGSGLRWLRLVRIFAGGLLLYPACMLIMSNYAATRGLLQGCSGLEFQPLGVCECFHTLSNDLLTKISIRYRLHRNAYSGHRHLHSSAQASSGQYSSIFTITATLKTNSSERSWLEQLLSGCFCALGAHGMHWEC